MKKLGFILLSFALCIGLFGCSDNSSKREANISIFNEYSKKELAEVDKLFEKEYIQIVDPYLDSSTNTGLFVFKTSSHKFTLRVESKDVTVIDMVYLKTGEGSSIFHSINHFALDPDNIIIKELILFLDAYSLNYIDFIDWILYNYKQNLKIGFSNLEYNFEVKPKDDIYNILKDKGYSINEATGSTEISIKNNSDTVYIDGKHYDITKEDEQPFVTMIIKDSVLNKRYPQLAYYIEYNSEYNYLGLSIHYGNNIQTLDVTKKAKSIAGDFIDDKANVILENDLKVMKQFHSKIESWLKETGITIADLCFFGMSYYGAYIKSYD